MELLRKYKTKIEDEVEKISNDINDLLDKHLIPKATTPESEVFYMKMKGDYGRYYAECVTGEKNQNAGKKANEAYKKATEKAASLPATNSLRLGLALNYSVFFYEIMNSPKEACKMAKTAFDGAIGDLESLDDDQYKESASIMQLLRDNLTLWTADEAEEDAPKGGEDVKDL